MQFKLYDETAHITDVFLHEPGSECEVALKADSPEVWLFDPSLEGVKAEDWLAAAQEEHEALTELVKRRGIRVHYLTKMLEAQPAKAMLLMSLEAHLEAAAKAQLVPQRQASEFGRLISANPVPAALVGISGLSLNQYHKLAEAGHGILVPKPNAYFAQDPFSFGGEYFLKLKPAAWQRAGEPELWEIALQPEKAIEVIYPAEGGDITIWNNKLMVGIGTRTHPYAAQQLNRQSAHMGLDGAIVTFKPDYGREPGLGHHTLQYIHDDTIKMPLPGNGFLGNSELLLQSLIWYEGYGHRGSIDDGKHFIERVADSFVPVAEHEQYSLPSNILPANGVVIAAEQNKVTNAKLRAEGYPVETFPASTLLGGCGGAHCMTNAVNALWGWSK